MSSSYLLELVHLSLHSIEPEQLHVIRLGNSKYMLGSVLWLLVFQVMDGEKHESDMEQVSDEIVDDDRANCVATQLS